MNEKTFKSLFPKVKLSVCPHKIQKSGNSVTDISILGQFHTNLQFRGEKYLNTFIVTNANDCPKLLSHGATFRMGVLLPKYPEENVVKGENVPNFKINTGASSSVFQILQDLRLKQYEGQYHSSTVPSTMLKSHKEQFHSSTTPSTVQKQYKGPYHPVPYQVPHLNSMKDSTIPVPCMLTQESPQVPATRYSTRHNQLLLSGSPHPPLLQLEE